MSNKRYADIDHNNNIGLDLSSFDQVAQRSVKSSKTKKSLPILEFVLLLFFIKIVLTMVFLFSNSASEINFKALSSKALLPATKVAEAAAPGSFVVSGNMPVVLAANAATTRNSLAVSAAMSASLATPVLVNNAAVSSSSTTASAGTNYMAMGAIAIVNAGADTASGTNKAPDVPAMPPSSNIPLPKGDEDLLKPKVNIKVPAGSSSGQTGNNAGNYNNSTIPTDFERREQELRKREEQLKVKEDALKSLEADLNKQFSAMEESKNDISSMTLRNEAVLEELKAALAQQKKDDEILKDARIQHLVTAYKSMKPDQAGNLVNSLDDDVAVTILAAMPGRTAGLILANVLPDKAARLTKAISEKRIDPSVLLDQSADQAPAQN